MIDAHCHLDFERFDADRDALLDSARAAGVRGWIVAGVDPTGWDRQAALAAREPAVRVAFGIHPHAAARMGPGELAAGLDALAGRLAFAVGETGLDGSKYVPRGRLPGQAEAFRAQLALARERDLPVILHILYAHGPALEILEKDGVPACGGQVHSYSGPAELVRRYEKLGLYLSFASGVTRPEGRRVRAAAAAVSADRLLVETDCPDQRPYGREGSRNLPGWLPDVVAALAVARDEAPEAVAERTAQNARACFGLPTEWP